MVIHSPSCRATEEDVHVTENAISAVLKIAQGQPGLPNTNELLAAWLSCLPVCEDPDESDFCANGLCGFIET